MLAPGSVRRTYSGSAAETPSSAALAGREPPEAAVPAELLSLLVDDLALGIGDAVTADEVAIVAAPEEARFLALGAAGDREPGSRGLGPGLVLRLLAEREPDPIEQPRVETSKHVGLVLLGSRARASSRRLRWSTIRA
mgnify:CR=1 FL=1